MADEELRASSDEYLLNERMNASPGLSEATSYTSRLPASITLSPSCSYLNAIVILTFCFLELFSITPYLFPLPPPLVLNKICSLNLQYSTGLFVCTLKSVPLVLDLGFLMCSALASCWLFFLNSNLVASSPNLAQLLHKVSVEWGGPILSQMSKHWVWSVIWEEASRIVERNGMVIRVLNGVRRAILGMQDSEE